MKHNPRIDEVFHQLHLGNIANVANWARFFEMVRGVPGDIVECGVGRGRSLTVLSSLNRVLEASEGGQREIWAYDSFEGFPEPTVEDKSPRAPKKGEWSSSPSGKYQYSPDFIRNVLKEAGLGEAADRVHFGKGYFERTLPDHPRRPIAILHADGDLYQSYQATLNNLFSLVSVGGIVVLDEIAIGEESDLFFPGARLAVNEFLAGRPEKLETSPSGICFIRKLS